MTGVLANATVALMKTGIVIIGNRVIAYCRGGFAYKDCSSPDAARLEVAGLQSVRDDDDLLYDATADWDLYDDPDEEDEISGFFT